MLTSDDHTEETDFKNMCRPTPNDRSTCLPRLCIILVEMLETEAADSHKQLERK